MTRRFVRGFVWSLVAVLTLNCSAMAGKSMELTSANTYYVQGDKAQALVWYEKAMAKNSLEAQVYARLVELYAEQQRWVEMNKAHSRLKDCKDKPKDLSKHQAEADRIVEQLWKGLWNGHVEQIKQADSLLAHQDSSGAKERFVQARDRMDKALLILPDRMDFLKRKGDLFIQEYNSLETGSRGFPLLAQAAQIYSSLTEAVPDSVEYALTLVQLTYNMREFEQCRKVVDKALERHATHPELLNYAGKVRIQQGLAMKNEEGKKLMGEASGYLIKAIELNPSDPMLVFNLALLYRDMNEPVKALETFARIEALAADRSDLRYDSYYAMAVLYFQDLPEAKQDASKAAEYFQKCLDLQPENKGLMFNLGVALVRTGTKENVAKGKQLMTQGQ